GQQERKAVMFRQRRPAGAVVVAGCGLAAAMQHDDQRARLLQLLGYEGEHAQRTGVRSEINDFEKRTVDAVTQATTKPGQSVEPIELRQMPQEVDIIGQ